MLGYLDDPAATGRPSTPAAGCTPATSATSTPRGYLTITDRLKDMYICGGFNVYPAEVEQVLARLDGVAEAAVIGVPDARLGEVGRAYMVTRPGSALDEAERAGVLPGAAGQLQGAPAGGVPRRPAPQPVRQGAQATAQGGISQMTGESVAGAGPADAEPVSYEERGPIALVTLNRPRYRNAQNSAMTYALDAAFARAVNDDAGRGDRAGRGRRPLLRRATTSAPPAGTRTCPSTGRRCCGGTTSARPAPMPGTPARWRSTSACAGAGGRSPSRRSRWCRAPASPAA